jgi:hypothetical protein
VRFSPRIAIVIAAVLVVIAAAAVVAFVWAGSAGSPTASPTRTGGIENGPPTATPTTPALNPTKPLWTGPAPTSASATGRLVTGFPAVAAPPDGATVQTSSLAVDGARVQAAVTAELASSPDAVQAAYHDRLSALGMTSAPGTAQPGTTVVTYYRSSDSITVTTTASGAGTALSVFGLFTLPKT